MAQASWWQPQGNPGWSAPQQATPQSSAQANAWQNQMTPEMFAQAQRYGAAHPQWGGYAQEAAGFTPSQIMAGQAPDIQAQTQASQKTGMEGLWAMLQGSVAPSNQAIDLLKQQLGLDTKNTAALQGLKEQDLRASTDIGMRRANAQIGAVQGDIAKVGKDRGFVDQLYGQANKSAGLEYGARRDALLSDATSRGAVNAHGTVGQFKNQYETFANQLAGNKTTRDKSMADLAQEERHLQTTASLYGFDKDQLLQNLHNGLSQLGIQGQIDLGQLFKQAAGLDAQKAANAQGIIQTLIGYSQGNPELLKGIPGFGPAGGGQSSPSFASGGHRVM